LYLFKSRLRIAPILLNSSFILHSILVVIGWLKKLADEHEASFLSGHPFAHNLFVCCKPCDDSLWMKNMFEMPM
jgi:hypothetical protein